MNMPVVSQSNLPAHLADFSSMATFGQDAVGGISVGKAHPRVSIKQNRFRLINEQGQEFVVPALHLDVIVVGVNKNVSKLYYSKAFNPHDTDAPAPDCFSDNGLAPSSRAANPQCGTCAACPHNVWGSKVTPSGTKVKSCSDSKKFAVVLADNPTGLVYELRVPAASMENVKGMVDILNQRKEPLPGYVIRLTFDETATHPKLIFNLVNYISPEQKQAVLEVLDGDEAQECVGKNDTPFGGALAATPAPQIQAPLPPAMPIPPVANFAPPAAPMPAPPAYNLQQAPQMPQVIAPTQNQGFNPMAPNNATVASNNAVASNPGFNPMGGASQPDNPQPITRKRRTKAEMAAVQGNVATYTPPVVPNFQAAQPIEAQGVAVEIPAYVRRDVPGVNAAAASVPVQPNQTDAALDSILGDALA